MIVSYTRLLAASLVLAFAASVLAQSSPGVQDDSALIQQLLKRIDDLESSQRQMKAQLAILNPQSLPSPAQAFVPPANAAQAPMAETPEPEQSAVPISHALGPLQFRGFSNFDYGRAWFEKLPPGGLPGSANSFSLGDFDLFINTRIGEHWSVLAEMLVTSDFSNEFAVEMDRLLLTYKKNDRFQISFGKYNTALGYFTNEFHRAQYFQTAIGRPIMYSDEDNGGLLPVHSIGVTASGAIPSGPLGLHWVAEAANGRSSLYSDVPIQNFKDDGNGKAVNFALYARPEGVHGLQAGVSVYRNTLHPLDLPAVGQTIYTAHAAYSGDRLEWLNEAAILRHAVHNGDIFHDFTAYTQVAYKFGKYRPYARYDQQNVPSGDPIFRDRGRYSGPSIGMSRRLSNYVVLKAQYGRLGIRDSKSSNVLLAQMAFAF